MLGLKAREHAFDGVVSNLLHSDRFMALADYQAYLDIQSEIEQSYLDEDRWTRMAVLNVARSGYFSSDRSMKDYLKRVWHTTPEL